jgi:hypothetical protein
VHAARQLVMNCTMPTLCLASTAHIYVTYTYNPMSMSTCSVTQNVANTDTDMISTTNIQVMLNGDADMLCMKCDHFPAACNLLAMFPTYTIEELARESF